MNYTSIEQSKKLLSLGLKAESADMCYVINYAESNKFGKGQYELNVDTYGLLVMERDNIPCWSVGALLEVMLRGGCTWALREERSMDIQIRKDGHNEDRWTGVCNSYLEAVFNMVVWLLENGYIKKE